VAEHLSRLELDEWLAGLDASGRAQRHVADCAACARTAEGLRLSKVAAMRDSKAAVVLARLEAKRAQEEGPRWSWSWGGPLVAALALGLAMVVYVPLARRPDGIHLKGNVALQLLAEDGTSVSAATPGSRVTLAVGTGAHRHVLVLGVEQSGAVAVLWPPEGRTSGTVEPGAQVRLSPPLEVTPGSVALHAFFGDAPMDVEKARVALAANVVEIQAEGEAALDAPAPTNIGEDRAHMVLRVEP
jgi:hypothetical protein